VTTAFGKEHSSDNTGDGPADGTPVRSDRARFRRERAINDFFSDFGVSKRRLGLADPVLYVQMPSRVVVYDTRRRVVLLHSLRAVERTNTQRHVQSG
jgi:hypothetical protein